MNCYAKTITLLLTAVCMTTACKSAPTFSDVQNKDWELVKAWDKTDTPPIDIRFERAKLTTEGFGDIFTLRFDSAEQRVNGVGAPNRYFAPYTLGGKQEISIKTIAQTQMTALREPEKLKERDFFMYLQNTAAWNLVAGKLELYSRGEDGAEVILYFVSGGKGK